MIEIKKVKAELFRVRAAKAEIEYQIALKNEEIQRLQNSLEKQILAEKDLEVRMNEMEK